MPLSARQLLSDCFAAAVQAVHGETLLRDHSRIVAGRWCFESGGLRTDWPLPDPAGPGRVRVFGAGKAAASMARGLEAVLGERFCDGLVVVKHGHGEALRKVRVVEGGHPLPDASSEAAAQALLAAIGTSNADDCCFVLLSGGASAVLAAPAAGVTLADKRQVTQTLVASRATIQQINTVRRHLSSIKGGQLARRLAPARVLTLAISDVAGDDLAAIGSGPTVADPTTYADALAVLVEHGLLERIAPRAREHLERGLRGEISDTPKPDELLWRRNGYRIIAGLDAALDAAAAFARSTGCEVRRHERALVGDTHARAAEVAALLQSLARERRTGGPPLMFIAGGETTLEVRGAGLGGRNQEFAVVAARELAGCDGVSLLAAGTDGTDGPTHAAGGFADGGTLARARQRGIDPATALRDNDSMRCLDAAGDLFVTGPTGTNVTDLVLALLD
jgi:hydroxypyruvate reductase